MRTALLLLAILATPAFAAGQTVWKWVDERGVTHYSDRPVPGATRMDLQVPAPSGDAPPAYADYSSSSPSKSKAAGLPYRNFEIWKPLNDETFTNVEGTVQVSILIEPALEQGHTVQLYFDGELVSTQAGSGQNYTLEGVPRGTHSLRAAILDRNGNQIQESSAVQFHVRQNSIANPPVGPALQPKPQRTGAANKLPREQPSYAALNGARTQIDPKTNRPVQSTAKPQTRPQ
jgi:hypothetical protein